MLQALVNRLVESTGDAAFAVDGTGAIVAWNDGATRLFGVARERALAATCTEIVRGRDEYGPVCREECWLFQSPGREPVRSFDLLVDTAGGGEWCTISVLGLAGDCPRSRFSIHVLSPAGMAKRLELTVRDFLAAETHLDPELLRRALARRRDYVGGATLSAREVEVLQHLARGRSTAQISEELGVSRATVNNHVQRVLSKLGAHTRLEAVRRAEAVGIL